VLISGTELLRELDGLKRITLCLANHYFRCKVSPPITAWFWDWLFLFQTCETNPNEAPGCGGSERGVARQFDSSCTQQRKQMQAPSDLPVPIDDGACDHLPGLALPAFAISIANLPASLLNSLA
jgi:hypothetical protein